MNLPAITLLALWETGAAHTAAARPAALLAASAGVPMEAAARLPLGWRDARLLEWYGEVAGCRLEALTGCPQCGKSVELEFDIADVRRPCGAGEPVTVQQDGVSLTWRPPDSLDFCHAAEAAGEEAARRVLLERCLTVEGAGEEEPPPHLMTKLMELAAAADPQADVRLALTCPACVAEWEAPFDIGAFLWARIQSGALRVLSEVHELAAAYSWSEQEVLSLSPVRRAAYLQLLRGT
jgi:hypothetical protein